MKLLLVVVLVFVTSTLAFGQSSPPSPLPYGDTRPSMLCWTRGHPNMEGLSQLLINDAVTRLVVTNSHPDAAKLIFNWRGRPLVDVPLASGQVRRQVGLKLRAESGCNLIYVMWRLEPVAGLDISIKVNPGMQDSGDCGAEGYAQVTPGLVTLPTALIGNEYTLESRISGSDIAVWVNDIPIGIWALPSSVQWLSGPVGLRSDNVVLDAELLVIPGPDRNWSSIPGC